MKRDNEFTGDRLDELAGENRRLREALPELETSVKNLLEWMPTCSKGSSGYLRREAIKKAVAKLKATLSDESVQKKVSPQEYVDKEWPQANFEGRLFHRQLVIQIMERFLAQSGEPVPPVQNWISVNKDMPKAEERVVVLTEKGEWWAARCKQFDNTSKYEKIFIPEGLHPINAVITHWKYVALPAAPVPPSAVSPQGQTEGEK